MDARRSVQRLRANNSATRMSERARWRRTVRARGGRVSCALLCLSVICCPAGRSAEWTDLQLELAGSMPGDLVQYLRESPGHEAYALAAWLNPYYLQAGFDGDGRTDTAVLVEEKATGRRGIMVVHIGAREHIVLGAGKPLGDAGDDLGWMDAWRVRPRGAVGQSPHEERPAPVLVGDALEIMRLEASSGLAYWNGEDYGWYRQSD